MRASTHEIGRLSPTFLATFLGCATSAAWTLEKRRGLRPEPEAVANAQADLIQRKGQEHEDRCLAELAAVVSVNEVEIRGGVGAAIGQAA